MHGAAALTEARRTTKIRKIVTGTALTEAGRPTRRLIQQVPKLLSSAAPAVADQARSRSQAAVRASAPDFLNRHEQLVVGERFAKKSLPVRELS